MPKQYILLISYNKKYKAIVQVDFYSKLLIKLRLSTNKNFKSWQSLVVYITIKYLIFVGYKLKIKLLFTKDVKYIFTTDTLH